MLAEKNGAGVGHAFKAFFGHGKNANLVDRAEAVFDGAHQAKLAVGIALEIQHRIDHVLQHARPRQRAVLGHVAHQHDGSATGLGRARQVRCALTHLGHRARRTGELLGIDRLYGVDHRDIRAVRSQGCKDFFQLDFRQHFDLGPVQPQAARAQCHLCATFFAGHVQGGFALTLQRIQRLQQQGGFTDAGVAADQHHTALHHATAQHAVELFMAGGGAVDIAGLDV